MVERLRDVVIGGDAAGWWMVVVVKKTKSLFCLRRAYEFPANAAYAAQYKEKMVALSYIT